MTSRATCLVIGGAGNLGGHIVGLLLERGHEVRTLDIVPYSGKCADKVQSIVGSVTDEAELLRAVSGASTVFHSASLIDIRPVPSLRMHHVNVDGTAAVIAACKAAGVATLVYTASLEVVSGLDVHGSRRVLDGVDESCPIPVQHHLPYASTKAYAERLVLAADCASLRTVSIRPGYIMGAGCVGLRLEMVRAAQRRGRYVTSKVPATISTCHAANCARLHLLAAEGIERPDVHGHAFFCRDFEANVVDMALEAFAETPIIPVLLPLPLAYFLAWIVDLFERALVCVYAAFGRTRQTPDEVLDIKAVGMAYIDIVVSDERAKRVLGYAPTVDRAACMREAALWCRDFYAQLTKA